ncbi:MAG: alpha/beta hydrolase [Planctomycetota bacterium]|nr:alpha/beta hydrolase [Planctomycetota bacterium]
MRIFAFALLLVFVSSLTGQDRAFNQYKNLRYVEGEGSDKTRHRLDLYVPKGVENPPLVMFIHGGAWTVGSKALYSNIGRWLAKHGYACAQNNYRLSPKVQHPVHVDDCARALAWLVKSAKKYGYDATRIFLSGHSAGGHLSSLLALSPTYLKKHGVDRSHVRGVFPLSGVYDCRSGHRVFRQVFGSSREGRSEASPVSHIHDQSPPFLVIWGDKDMAGLPEDARRFVAALKDAKRPVASHEAQGRTHMSIFYNIGREGDKASALILGFLREVIGGQ